MAKLTQCPNGHFYDAERSPQCPYCPQSEAQPPAPPDCPGEEEFLARMAEQGHTWHKPPDRIVKCPNGHLYDQSKSPNCPYCGGQNTAETPPADGADAGKTVPLQEEAVDRTVPLQQEVMNQTQPLSHAGMDRTVPLADAGAPARQGNWPYKLLRIAAGAAAFDGLLAAFECFRLLGLTYENTLGIGFLWHHPWTRGFLVDIICCVVTCLCCAWCLRTKGAQPGFPLSVVLAAANIGLALYGCNYLFRLVSIFGLSRAIVSLRVDKALIEAVPMLLCLIAAILAWAAIFLYQRKQKQNKI